MGAENHDHVVTADIYVKDTYEVISNKDGDENVNKIFLNNLLSARRKP